jgi:hypothetical protein
VGFCQSNHVLRDENGKRFVFKFPPMEENGNHDKWVDNSALACEVVFSHIANELGTNSITNNFSTRKREHGVLSPWFLGKNQRTGEFAKTPLLHNYSFDIFQNTDLKQTLAQYEKNFTLHRDFKKNFIETYLLSVLTSNKDHFENHNICTQIDFNGTMNMSPYHDMEFSTFFKNTWAYKSPLDFVMRGQRILQGYRGNLKHLRMEYREIHDHFLDGLNDLDVDALTDIDKPHIIKFMNDTRHPEKISNTLNTKLKSQIIKLKNFTCVQ